MWIDTHSHFDVPSFDATRSQDWARAQQLGVSAQIIPAVTPDNFEAVRSVAHAHTHSFYALGIHPIYVMNHSLESSIQALRAAVLAAMDDARFVAIGEIGLDGFVPDVDMDVQVAFLRAQLKIAREFDLPVLLHVRRSVDAVGKHLREFGIRRGIAHAFNGSFEQAQRFIEMGLHLGFGGVLTFERALQIRRLAVQLPIDSLVLETDAPDMPPAWLMGQESNHSYHLPRIAQTLALLRGISADELARSVWHNSLNAVPRLQLSLPNTAPLFKDAAGEVGV